MARHANQLSAIQLDDETFGWIKEQIDRFLPSYLCTLADVSRTTIYMYARREPINPSCEREIKRAIKKAFELQLEIDKKELNEIKNLIEKAKTLAELWLK